MKISLNTIKQYTQADIPVSELVAKINTQLGGVEDIVELGDKYKNILIVKIVECDKHPDADRLSICKIDDGGVCQDVERDANGLVRVVCGAPNVHTGMFAAWLPPGSTLPTSYDDADPFVLGKRELRGVVSNGMLAASDELALGGDHDGILELDTNESRPDGLELKPGMYFADAYGLNDTIIDIENKMFTHRPDCFGQLGVAREIAGIQHKSFRSPEWYLQAPDFNDASDLKIDIENHAADKSSRFMAVAIKDVEVMQSPLWLQCELIRLGSKPINNIVDVTNYVMLLTGQPLHAYDYDKLRGNKLGVRMARENEKVSLLNGKTYTLTPDDIVIVDEQGPVGLGGIMGGGDSEVSKTTKNIVLECANFDMYAIRKTSMRHGLFTDAVTRFNKGQSALQNPQVLGLAMQAIFDTAGGSQASNVYDVGSERQITQPIPVSVQFVNERLGLLLTKAEIIELLQNVEISTVDNGPDLSVSVPFWRTDLELPEDIVEEVGRLYGFDKLSRVLPTRSIAPVLRNNSRVVKQRIRESLAMAGANEVLTYSFVHENVLKHAEQDVPMAFSLGNALSPDLQYYRLSVLPSLLDKVHANIKAGYDEFVLFEIGKGHSKRHQNGDDNLPIEPEFVDFVYANKHTKEGAAYYRIARVLMKLVQDLGFTAELKPITDAIDIDAAASFDPARSALIVASDGAILGVIGELKPTVTRKFKLPEYAAAVTLDLAKLIDVVDGDSKRYKPLSRFPSITQDLSLKVPSSVPYGALIDSVNNLATEIKSAELDVDITPQMIYQPEESDTKTVTLRFTFTNYTKTLTDSDAHAVLDAVEKYIAKSY